MFDINAPANVRYGEIQRDFASLLQAVVFAVDECPPGHRHGLRLQTCGGDQFHWGYVASLYRIHVLGDPED